MKSINTKISNKAYKNLINYKLDENLKNIGECLDKILIELKGGDKK